MHWLSLRIIVLAALGLSIVPSVEPQMITPTKDHPVVEVDVRKFGYEQPNYQTSVKSFVDFTDNSHIAVAWLTLDGATKKIGPATPWPSHLHVLTIDAVTGEKTAQKDFATPHFPVGFAGMRDGHILTLCNNELSLLSPGLDVIRVQDLEDRNEFIKAISPSSHSLLLAFTSGNHKQLTIKDSATFAPLSEWVEEQQTWDISDHWIVGSCGNPVKVCVRRFDEFSHPLRPSSLPNQTPAWSRNARAWFVDDEILVIGGMKRMTVATVNGDVLFEVWSPDGHAFTAPVKSVAGKFAIIEDRRRGPKSEALDMYFYADDQAVVYSVTEKRAIFAVKLKGESPWAPWERHQNQIALSPDGGFLAVLSDGILKTYQLPK